MSLSLGTNCGFVSSSPSSDPDGSTTLTIDAYRRALRDTTPSGTNLVVTEIGFYTPDATEEANYEVAIYDLADAETPGDVVGWDQTNAKGTSAGWIKCTGLNIPVSASTNYFIAVQLDNTSTTTNIDAEGTGTGHYVYNSSATTLPDPWGTTSYGSRLLAIYAVVGEAEEPGEGTNCQINIGDAWKEIAGMQINIGDDWKEVAGAQINIGDDWKTIF